MLAGEGEERRHEKCHVFEFDLLFLEVALQPPNPDLRQPSDEETQLALIAVAAVLRHELA